MSKDLLNALSSKKARISADNEYIDFIIESEDKSPMSFEDAKYIAKDLKENYGVDAFPLDNAEKYDVCVCVARREKRDIIQSSEKIKDIFKNLGIEIYKSSIDEYINDQLDYINKLKIIRDL